MHMQWKNPKYDGENECNCCIEIEDSLVLIICGEIDPDKLRESLKTFLESKSNTTEVQE